MRITIDNPEIEQQLVALAAADRLPVHTVVVRLLQEKLSLSLSAEKPRAVDRNADLVLAILRRNTGGLTVHDICGITGWCYVTGTKVMRYMLEKGLVDRELLPTRGAPAQIFTERIAAPAVAAASTAPPSSTPIADNDLPSLTDL